MLETNVKRPVNADVNASRLICWVSSQRNINRAQQGIFSRDSLYPLPLSGKPNAYVHSYSLHHI